MVKAGLVKNLFDKGGATSSSSPQGGMPPARSKLQKMKTKLSSKVTIPAFKPKKSKTTIGDMISIGHPDQNQGLYASDLTDDAAFIITTHTTGTVCSWSVYIQGIKGKNIKLSKLDNVSAIYYPDSNHDAEGVSAMCVLGPVLILTLNNSSDLVLIKVQVSAKNKSYISVLFPFQIFVFSICSNKRTLLSVQTNVLDTNCAFAMLYLCAQNKAIFLLKRRKMIGSDILLFLAHMYINL